jgi:hypothetical protein
MKSHIAIAECACCIVEHLQSDGVYPAFLKQLGDDEGAAQERTFIVTELADFVERAYFYAQALGYDLPFDWEFVPAVMVAISDWQYFHERSARDIGVQIGEQHALNQPIPFD